jgi:hypothetical protein
MRKKQGHKVRQRTPATMVAPISSKVLEQKVLKNPVVQEVMRLFDARLGDVVWTGAREGKEYKAVEQ